MTEKRNAKRYLLLGSRIALGVYVPAVTLKKQIEDEGGRADIVCLEDLYKGRDQIIEKSKRSFHSDFRLAKLSYRMPAMSNAAVDAGEAAALMDRIIAENYDAIITFSGFWAGFLGGLADTCPGYRGKIYAVHMDAVYSKSWDGADTAGLKEIWLYSLERNAAEHMLEAPDASYAVEALEEDSSPDNEEAPSHRILVHGGGWGIGDYKSAAERLNELGYPLDIIIYYPEEYDGADHFNEYYMLDPDWRPDADRNEFPRLLRHTGGKWIEYGDNRGRVNPLRNLMKRAAAVLSKPGGGTLSDSLAAATPLIFTEALASYERDNRLLWINKGWGIGAEDFVSSPDRDALLAEMRQRLLDEQSGLSNILKEID